MSIQEICRVARNEQLGDGLFRLVLDAPQIAAAAQCGQFVHIACGEGNLLRRPISICLAEDGALHIVFQVKGSGTEWLAGRKEGDTLDVLGPLGHGFDVAALGAKPVFLGGGIGVPPMLQTVKCVKAAGAAPRCAAFSPCWSRRGTARPTPSTQWSSPGLLCSLRPTTQS